MELNIKNLSESGSFAGAPVEKEIKWEQDGVEHTATTYIRKLSYKSAVSDIKTFGGDLTAGRIASCVCDKKGEPVFTTEDITGEADSKRGPLNHNLTITLLNAIAEVNGLVKKKKTQRKKVKK